ncbi:MAG: bifunctional riboflavin kinase/FAD synthetase [Candidatus Margulisiibacteriota bacterium]
MKTIRSLEALKNKKIVLALGNFDGVHLGHKKVIEEAVHCAKRNSAVCVVMTFDPHPRTVIYGQKDVKLLTTIAERQELIVALGADHLWIVDFNSRMQALSASGFVNKYFNSASVIKVVVGFDFAFGKGRTSSALDLEKIGHKRGFSVSVVKHRSFKGRIVKSSLIRELISAGKFSEAAGLLGHSYPVSGKVIKGRGMGKKLGFPTANIKTSDDKLFPPYGVYAGTCVIKGKKYRAAVNIGNRPTFGTGFARVEAHVIGYNKNLLGKELIVWLTKKIRDEKMFSNEKELIAQIKKDVAGVFAKY